MAKITIKLEDRDGSVNLQIEFDPPIKNGMVEVTQAQALAIDMFKFAGDKGENDGESDD